MDGAKEISLRADPTLMGRGKAGTSGISRGVRGRNCKGKVGGRGRGRGTKRCASADPTLRGRGKAGTSGISRAVRGRNCEGKVGGRGRGTKRRAS